MLTARQMATVAALSLIASALAVIAHDVSLAAQLTRLLSRPGAASRAALTAPLRADAPTRAAVPRLRVSADLTAAQTSRSSAPPIQPLMLGENDNAVH